MSAPQSKPPDPRQLVAPEWDGPRETPPPLCSYDLTDYEPETGTVLFDPNNPLAWVEFDGMFVHTTEGWR